MDTNNIKDKFAQSAKDVTADVGAEMAKSGEDWLSYIKAHPLQSVLFGIIGFYALKGLVKS